LKRWLDPKLDQPVGIQVVPFQGYAQLLSKVATKAQMYLDGPSSDEIVAVIGLLDLYGPQFYPGHLTSASERYEWAVRHIQREVGRDGFRMFFAVHEYEAWLLSEPTILPAQVRSAIPGRAEQPETVNFDEPPAKLLDRIYKARLKRTYKTTTYGKELFARLDPAVAVQKCPYLKSMLEEMLRLARAAGL
jgi:hypothetical protein